MPNARTMLIAGALLTALVAVFLLYTRSDFMVQIANQLWSCF